MVLILFLSYIFILFFIEVWLIYNIVLVSGVQQSDSVLYIYARMLSHFSCVQLSVTLWTIARQAPLSIGFSRQEYWSGLPCPPPGDLPDLGIEPISPASPL